MLKVRLLFLFLFSVMAITGRAWAQSPSVTVTTTAQTGQGSLSSAIAFANANPGSYIKFAIRSAPPSETGGVFDFVVPSGTSLNADVTIDGESQTTLTGDTNPSGPEVSIDGIDKINANVKLASVTFAWSGTLTDCAVLTIDDCSVAIWCGGNIEGLVCNYGVLRTGFTPGVPGRIVGGTIDNKCILILGNEQKTSTLVKLQQSATAPARPAVINNSGECIVWAGVEAIGGANTVFNNSGTCEQRGLGKALLFLTFNNSGLVEAKGGRFVVGSDGIHTGTIRATAPGYVWLSVSSSRRAVLRDGARFEGNGNGTSSQAGTIRVGYSKLEGDVWVSGTVFIADDGSSLKTADATPSLISDFGQFSGDGVVRWVRGIVTGYLLLTPDNAPTLRWEGGYLKGTIDVATDCLLYITKPGNSFDFAGNGVKEIIGGAINNDGMVEFGVNGKTPTDVLLTLRPSADGKQIASVVTSGIWTSYAGSRSEGSGAMLNQGLLRGNGTLASLSNAGTISPGGDKIGTITITGDLSQTDCGTLLIDIADRTPSGLDKIIVCGFLFCDGIIDVRSNPVTLRNEDCFIPIEHSGAAGNFPSVSAPFRAEINPADVSLIVDSNLLSATITGPAASSTVSSLTKIYGGTKGAATQSKGGKVVAYLRRSSDQKFWNGSTWGSSAPLATEFASDGTTWRMTKILPTGSNLLDGQYYIAAVPYDSKGQKGVAASRVFTLRQATAATATSTSNTQLSSASATSSGSIRLTFTTALNASATNPANYSVSADGVAVAVESVQQINTSTVEISVGALTAGQRVTVSYNVQDAQGRAVAGQANVVVR
ncbi:MAG TPA: hypothetical protein VF681_00270 [Abditibacteriaceae bacterium]|jgi:hypothetical protein